MQTQAHYPLPREADIRAEYVGKNLDEVPAPSAILDLAKLRKNCQLMLDAVRELDVGFRAHIKTHKTLQLSKMQVGEHSRDVRLICSTLAEMEFIQPLIADFQQKSARANVLYGIPAGPSHASRLSAFLRNNGPGSLTLMVDNDEQLSMVSRVHKLAGQGPVDVFIKCDSGYHRAGLPPASNAMKRLTQAVLELESTGVISLIGFYTHNSLSYGGNNPRQAMDNLRAEIDASVQAAEVNLPTEYASSRKQQLVVSSGASPTALSLQNLVSKDPSIVESESAVALRKSLAEAKSRNIQFEIHAGVYPTFDNQQCSAQSRDLGTRPEDNIAFFVLSEVTSTYPDRTEIPEALVHAGGLAMGREPCKSYRGHGVVSPWGMNKDYDPYSQENRIIIDRTAQEHGVLQWQDKSRKAELPVKYGQRLLLWPNHACIAGSHFPFYLVVDSSSQATTSVVQDVWVRCRGW